MDRYVSDPPESYHGSMAKVVVHTEEIPSPPEIVCGLRCLGLRVDTCTVTPIYSESNQFLAYNADTSPTSVSCTIYSADSTTAMVDYTFEMGDRIVLLESTKTSNKDSRNTCIPQRIIKFLVGKHYYPTAQCVMFYKDDPRFRSSSVLFAARLLSTLGISVYTPYAQIPTGKPFQTTDDLIKAKRVGRSPPKTNVPIQLYVEDGVYVLSGRLNKTVGRMDHDPNVGLFSGIISTLYKLDPTTRVRIINHGLDPNRLTSNTKFWHALRGIDVRLDGIPSLAPSPLPPTYFKRAQHNERTASILMELEYVKSGFVCIFRNHAQGERSFLMDPSGKGVPVPKGMTYPDMVLLSLQKGDIYVVESKLQIHMTKAVKQLRGLDPFDALLRSMYAGPRSIHRGMCICSSDFTQLTSEYPIWFRLFPDGTVSKTLPT